MRASSWRFLICLACACAHVGTLEQPPLTKAVALSALNLPVVNGAAFEPQKMGDSVLLVTFVASWCFPCLSDLPVLQKLEHSFAKDDFHNLVVGLDLEGEAALVPMAKQFELTFPVLLADTSIRAGQSPFGAIRQLPVRVLFGRDGHAIEVYAGLVEPMALEAAVKRAALVSRALPAN
jgi:thiol-disulfide isomerase/thioredoxin